MGADEVGFDHVTVVVSDLDEAIGFFALLGFDEGRRVVVEGETMASYMGITDWKADHVTLALRGAPARQEVKPLRFHQPEVQRDLGSGNLGRSGFNHLCFKVADLDAMVGRLEAAGHRRRNNVLIFHDRRLVFFEGPAGVTIELAQWLTTEQDEALRPV